MNRIDEIFQGLRGRGRKALMPFVVAGDPDLQATGGLLGALERGGASVCELGIPFSDPIADGPVIQGSMAYALERGVTPGQVLELVARVRPSLKMGLVGMVSYSIVYRMGGEGFLREAHEAGLDGVILPDLPVEEAERSGVLGAAAELGLVCSLLIAPSTPAPRAERIARASTGFVYLLAREGITGERAALPMDLTSRVSRLRTVTGLPIAVGFGISNARQVRQVVEVADAAIVGSALMRRIAESRPAGPEAVVEAVERLVRELSEGLEGVSAAADSGV
jgi:tryptophan synthase alpha chain